MLNFSHTGQSCRVYLLDQDFQATGLAMVELRLLSAEECV